MAMTIAEANAIQALVRWATAAPDADLNGDAAREALILLAGRSQARLLAGSGPDQVREAWPVPGRPRGARAAALGVEPTSSGPSGSCGGRS